VSALSRANRDAYFRSTKPTPSNATVGDRVGYSRYFLISIGLPPTDPDWRRMGVVVELVGERLVRVRWDDGESVLVARTAIAKPGSLSWAE
jgi:hypothetical protein